MIRRPNRGAMLHGTDPCPSASCPMLSCLCDSTGMPARDAASTLAAGLVDANITHLALLNTPRNVRDNLVTLDEVRTHCLLASHGGRASLTQGYRMPTGPHIGARMG